MPRLLIASPLVLLAALAPAAPVPPGADKPAPYYATKIGARWTYSGPHGYWEQVVTAVEEKGGAKVVTVGEVAGDGRVVPCEKVRVSGTGLAQVGRYPVVVRPGGRPPEPEWVPDEPPVDLLRLAASPGDGWEAQHNWGWRNRYADRGRERVKVPAGEFDARVVDVVRTLPGQVPDRFRYWYARGIGAVKWTGPDGEVVLKSFDPGR